MKILKSTTTWVAGIAIFSMFFGAGNVVFPLLLGTKAGDQNAFATLGLLLTSIGGPLIGLFGAILFQGNFKAFFCRIGVVPGFILMILTSLLLGPFAVMPRCMVVSYAAISPFLPSISLFSFSMIGALIVFALTFKKNNLISILGYVLSPILIVCLVLIIILALFNGSVSKADISSTQAFSYGLLIGYDTMDLIASIFFSVSIWNLLKTRIRRVDHENNPIVETKVVLASGCIAGILLGLIYTGFSSAASMHTSQLQGIEPENILTTMAFNALGPIFGALANIAIALACFTTIMSLAVTFSEILRKDFHLKNISHSATTLILVLITAIFSNLGFENIMKIIHPTVEIFYPAIIVMTLCNIGYKLFNFKVIKTPVYATFIITILIKAWLLLK